MEVRRGLDEHGLASARHPHAGKIPDARADFEHTTLEGRAKATGDPAVVPRQVGEGLKILTLVMKGIASSHSYRRTPYVTRLWVLRDADFCRRLPGGAALPRRFASIDGSAGWSCQPRRP